jgi:hypothetical protein
LIRIHIWHPVATPGDGPPVWARDGLPRDRGALPAYTPLTFMLAHASALTFSTPHSVEAWLDVVNRWLPASSAEPQPAHEPPVPEPLWGGA